MKIKKEEEKKLVDNNHWDPEVTSFYKAISSTNNPRMVCFTESFREPVAHLFYKWYKEYLKTCILFLVLLWWCIKYSYAHLVKADLFIAWWQIQCHVPSYCSFFYRLSLFFLIVPSHDSLIILILICLCVIEGKRKAKW
jgi:hypothetical protein